MDLSNKTPKQVARHYGLKPCPFCGGEASFKKKHQRAYCEPCGISISHHWINEYDERDGIRHVIEKWNKRFATPESPALSANGEGA